MDINLKCKDLVSNKLKGRIDDLTKLWKLYLQDSKKSDGKPGNMDEYGVCFDYIAPNTFKKQKVGYFRYQLSCGRPSDEFRFDDFKFYVDLDYKPYKIEYWYMEGFDSAKKILYGKNFRLLAEIFEIFFVESGKAECQFNVATKK
jgi:hypothetical protein